MDIKTLLRLIASIVSVPPVTRILTRPVDCLELLERAPRPHRHAGERRLGEVARHLGLVSQTLVEALEKRSTASQHDPAIHDVGRKFGRGAVERLLDGTDDLRERLLERAANLLGGQYHRLRKAGDEVAPANLSLNLLGEREGRADLELDLLRGLLPDHQFVLALDVVDDAVVHL